MKRAMGLLPLRIGPPRRDPAPTPSAGGEGASYSPPPTGDEQAPGGLPDVTYRYATFGTERVMVADGLLADLERRRGARAAVRPELVRQVPPSGSAPV